MSLCSLWCCADAANSLRDRTQSAVNHHYIFLGFIVRRCVHCGEKIDGAGLFGGVDVPSVDVNALKSTCYITAVNQRSSGGGDIWRMKTCVCFVPPTEKEPSSFLWMMRLSTCSVMGEGSESDGLSRGPSSCRC